MELVGVVLFVKVSPLFRSLGDGRLGSGRHENFDHGCNSNSRTCGATNVLKLNFMSSRSETERQE